jgi:hypothetical protein
MTMRNARISFEKGAIIIRSDVYGSVPTLGNK